MANETLLKQIEVIEAQKVFITKQFELQIVNLDERIADINKQMQNA